MRGTNGFLTALSFLGLYLAGCGASIQAENFADDQTCVVAQSSPTAVLGQPITFHVKPKTLSTTEIAWSAPTAKWIPSSEFTVVKYAEDVQMVKISDTQSVAKTGYQSFRLVYDMVGEAANGEVRELFLHPGSMRQTFQIIGPAGCKAEIDVPLSIPKAYQDAYWAKYL